MHFITTIAGRELARTRRARRFYRKRLVLPALTGVMVIAAYWYGDQQQITTMGLDLFTTLGWLAMAVACLVPCCSASPIFAGAKEHRVLEILLVSNVAAWQLVVGHLASCMLRASVSILSLLPMFVLCVSLGGVSATQILQAFVVLLATVFVGTCLGLCTSMMTRDRRTAFNWAVFAGVIFFGAVPGVAALAAEVCSDPATQTWCEDALLPTVSPLHAFKLLSEGMLPAWGAAWVLYAGAVGAGLLALTALLFPRMARPGRTRVAARPCAVRTEHDDEGPLMRRERSRAHTLHWVGFPASMAACLLISHDLLDDPYTLPWVILGVSAALFALPLLLRCCRVLAEEKEARTFELLTLTSMSPQELLFGRLQATIRGCLPWLVSMSLAAVYIAWDEYEFALAGNFLCCYAVSLFTYSVVALYLSLRWNAYVALGATTVMVGSWAVTAQLMLGAHAGGLGLFSFEFWHLVVAAIILRNTLQRVGNVGFQR